MINELNDREYWLRYYIKKKPKTIKIFIIIQNLMYIIIHIRTSSLPSKSKVSREVRSESWLNG